MKENEFYTIKEVSELMGVSVQSVYSKIKKEFKPYLKLIDGKKYLKKEVLNDINDDYFKQKDSSSFKVELNLLKAQNNQLINQLDEKDQQIRSFQKLLENQQILTLKANEKIDLLESENNKQKSKWWQFWK